MGKTVQLITWMDFNWIVLNDIEWYWMILNGIELYCNCIEWYWMMLHLVVKDPRLDGGYENVPTRDIHMRQIGMEHQWLYFLAEFVRPLQERVFLGYIHYVRFGRVLIADNRQYSSAQFDCTNRANSQ